MSTPTAFPLRPLHRAAPFVTPPPPGTAHLIEGDNREALRACQGPLGRRVAFIYLDPPFFTKRVHDRVLRVKSADHAAPQRTSRPAFDDRWDSLSSYLQALRERLELMRALLIPEGSVVVHVDPKTSHYVKVLGDEVFGFDNFASEIIWRYRRWPSKTKNFQRVHDVMLRWVRDADAPSRFVQLYEPLAPSTLKTWGRGKQRAVFDKDGRRRKSSTQDKPSPGVPMGDVWEIPIVAPVAKERTGYPTQKPEALLRRLIEACTVPGDLVLDPYMGSGTTVSVACRMQRAAVGMDVGREAFDVVEPRLKSAQVPFTKSQTSSLTCRDDDRLENDTKRRDLAFERTGTLG